MHPRNFYIAQDPREIMYFGNAYGVIEYDGSSWRNIPLNNGNSALALGIGKNETVYVGSFDELGYLSANASGNTVYQSLSSKIPLNKNLFKNIQGVFADEDTVIYHSSVGLYRYQNDTFQVVQPSSPENRFQYVQKIDRNIYVQEQGKGLQLLQGNRLSLIPGGELLKHRLIKELLPLDESRLLILEDKGLFIFHHSGITPLSGEVNAVLKLQQLTHALLLKNGNILVTTYNNGFYVVSPTGTIVKHVHQNNGLPNNTIHYAYTDKRGGLWLAMDNGITYLEINTPFSFIGNTSGIQGLGYTSVVFQNKLYVGTSQGVYYTPWEKGFQNQLFKPVAGIQGQVWGLYVIENTLICCHGDFLYQIKNERAERIPGKYDEEGHWKVAPLRNKPGYAIKGTYLGLQIYRLENGKWTFVRKLKGFDESCRMFEENDQGIWVCHGNKGMYKIQLSDELDRITDIVNYSERKKIPPDFFNYVSWIDQKLVFSTDKGAYVFDAKKDSFVKHQALEKIIGADRFLNRIFQYEDGNIWVFCGDDLNLYRKISEREYKTEQHLFKKLTGELVGSYEFVMPVYPDLNMIGSQEGFILFDLKEKTEQATPFPIHIRKIEIPFHQDSVVFGGNGKTLTGSRTFSFNTLRISYAAICYENPEKIKYQYALSSAQNPNTYWSGWTDNTQVDFSNLYEGEYTFHVRAKSIYGELNEAATYSFVILPPWYRSVFAYLLYTLLTLGTLLVMYRYIKLRFKKQKQKELLLLEQKHLTEKLLTEKELIALRNEKLESEVILKNTELASLATTLTQKTEFLSHLKDKLETIHKDSDNENSNTFKEVIKTIDQDLEFDDNWAKFQVHFDELHHNFLHRLREKYPKLNPSWLLLCAYIRMNKSNKEIATHLNISVAGVEKRKYRLREKLGMDNEERLSDFIANF